MPLIVAQCPSMSHAAKFTGVSGAAERWAWAAAGSGSDEGADAGGSQLQAFVRPRTILA
jgi:hypothetical protein